LLAVADIDKDTFADSYAFALQQLNHMVIVEELFNSRLTNRPAMHKSNNTKVVPNFSELKQRLLASCDWYSSYVADLESQEEKISFTFTDGKRGMMTVQEILFHIVNHGSYHRGNIAHALDLASIPHPIDGYGAYIHQKEPNRRNG